MVLVFDKFALEIVSFQMFFEQTQLISLSDNVREAGRFAFFVTQNLIRVQIHYVLSIGVDIAENILSHTFHPQISPHSLHSQTSLNRLRL